MEQRIFVKDQYNNAELVKAEVTNKRWGNGGRTLYGTVVIDGKEKEVMCIRGNNWECKK